MGGLSSEREVSLRSGKAIAGSLKRLGFRVIEIDLNITRTKRLRTGETVIPPVRLAEFLIKEKIDCVFLALHGGIGENGAIQGFLEVLGIPYTGSGIMASSLAMDKFASKRLFREAGLMVPDFVFIEEGGTGSRILDEVKERIGFPLVVKPACEGSSVGVNIVEEPSQFMDALKEASRFGPCLVERYIRGKEIHVGILRDKPLGAVEVRPREKFYSYRAKYTQGLTEYIIPPGIPEKFLKDALDCGLKAHRALGCRGATRVDLIVTEHGDVYVLEVNTIPGMTETSLLPKIAASSGINFDQLVMEILRECVQRELEV